MHRVRLVRLADVFLTGLSIRQFGGVPGLFMTLADIDSFDSVTLHGPVHTDAVVAAARSFASNPQHTLQVRFRPRPTVHLCLTVRTGPCH